MPHREKLIKRVDDEFSKWRHYSTDHILWSTTDRATGNSHVPGNSSHGVYCPSNPDSKVIVPGFNDSGLALLSGYAEPGPNSTFDYYWNPSTVACFLTVLIPLISLRSITFFTKFNSLGKSSSRGQNDEETFSLDLEHPYHKKLVPQVIGSFVSKFYHRNFFVIH